MKFFIILCWSGAGGPANYYSGTATVSSSAANVSQVE